MFHDLLSIFTQRILQLVILELCSFFPSHGSFLSEFFDELFPLSLRLSRADKELPAIAFDFAFLKTNQGSGKTNVAGAHATQLVAVDVDSGMIRVVPCPRKECVKLPGHKAQEVCGVNLSQRCVPGVTMKPACHDHRREGQGFVARCCGAREYTST